MEEFSVFIGNLLVAGFLLIRLKISKKLKNPPFSCPLAAGV
jgi:hypothetical protein